MVFQNNVLLGAAGSGTTRYAIDQSIRFNDDDSAYMYKTFSGAGNQKKFTISYWIKRSKLGVRQDMWSFQQDVPLIFFSDDTIRVFLFGGTSLVTNRKFRDVGAWYHVVLTVDSTDSTSGDRIRLYINGQRETSFSTESYPSQDADASVWTSGLQLRLFRLYGGTNYYDGYAAEIHYLDGISYGPEFFGETTSNGLWVPKAYTGSYGGNGFKIDGRDSADLGDDESGNGNDFTTSGLAAHDQVSDTPTNNFATFNSIYNDSNGLSDLTYANGNLQADGTGSGQFDYTVATYNLPKSGKWYFEHYLGGRYTGFGLCLYDQISGITSGYGFGALSTSQGFGFQDNVVYNGNSATVSFGIGNQNAGDILNCALDVDNNKVFLGVNGTYYANDGGNDGNPSSGSNETLTTSFSLSTNEIIIGFYFSTADGTSFINFGQEGTFGGNKTAGGNSDANEIGNFFNTVPTNYLALCSKNVGS